MSTTNDNKRQQLISKLREMFQMDQADLDFGIYRIMNAKRDEISQFLEQDLLPTLRTTLQEFQPAGLADKQKELADAIANAKKLKIDPDSLEVVQQLKAELAEGGDLDRMEDQVYSDLYTFFSRYYQDGDFLSLRRYKEGVYAMPYEGEEVKLHWANADQYYIKTAENFTRYAFKTEKGRVRFELASATTERDNVKATADNERRFVLAEQPLKLDGDELVISFEYRPDEEKRKQKELNTQAIDALLTLPEGAPLTQAIGQWMQWRSALASVLPTEKNKSRSVLEKHLTDYTAKNTFDYFIHKDLGRFMRRELDFFIKNEVMHLDDVESESAPKVESYLARIKATRRIAHKLIDFLVQLENFQKRLWLKKKFVLDTQWLITLDRIHEALYPEICEEAEVAVRGWDGRIRSQREDWIELFGIDRPPSLANTSSGEGAGLLFQQESSSYSIPLTPAFLKAHPSLILDTVFFNSQLKEKILAEFENLDAETSGVLVHGENFQGLNLLAERFRSNLNCIYIDPPYNTGGDGFAYKDSYQHSSWLSLLQDRISKVKDLVSDGAPFFASIDDNELLNLSRLLNDAFGSEKFISNVIVQSNKRGQTYQQIAKTHEYLLCYSASGVAQIKELPKEMKASTLKDEVGFYELWELRNRNPKFGRFNRPNLFYPVYVKIETLDDDGYAQISVDRSSPTDIEVFPRNSRSEDSCWRWSQKKLHEGTLKKTQIVVAKMVRNGGWNIYEKARKSSTKVKSIWTETEFISEQGTTEATSLGLNGFGFPKPTKLIEQVVKIGTEEDGLICDFFAGSGTTAHAVINCNRDEEGSERRYLLIEAGAHFDSVLLPRVKKATYASEWTDGIPNAIDSVSSLIKYVRLESYEDACNNLTLKRSEEQQSVLEPRSRLREEYFLRYLLDTESRDCLMNLDRFINPFDVRLIISCSDETRETAVDMVETFNYLLGLRVKSLRRVKGVLEVTGISPAGEQVLILWRNTVETNSQALNDWFETQAYNSRDTEFDLIYVNGDNNIENLRRSDETWKVQLIEDRFMSLMFTSQD